MYDYRRWTPEQRSRAVVERIQRGYPWHSPPHLQAPAGYRIVTGTCFDHQEVLSTPERLAWFESELLNLLQELDIPCAAWCVLPNHYHVLVWVQDIQEFSRRLGQLHGRTSHTMNMEDNTIGRKVWFRSHDRCMRSERHYYATLNYIHNNPVKHGYVEKWTDWPYSSVHWYLETQGRNWMLDMWREYPVLNYGDTWDV